MTNILADALTNTRGIINCEKIDTTIGVPPGAVLSLTLFNLFVNDLINLLTQKGITTLAYAYDIAFIAKGSKEQLIKCIKVVETWCECNRIKINKGKSGILCIRADKRTRAPNFDKVRDIPLVKFYKYLGIIIDDCGSIMPFLDHLKSFRKEFKSRLTLQWAHKFSLEARLQVWRSLVYSKFKYGMVFLASKYEKALNVVKSFLYQSIKALLHFKNNPNAEKLFQLTLGSSAEECI